jgi:hypothetical protein
MTVFIVARGKESVARERAEKAHMMSEAFAAAKAGRCFCCLYGKAEAMPFQKIDLLRGFLRNKEERYSFSTVT